MAPRATKRKASAAPAATANGDKKARTTTAYDRELREPHHAADVTEKHGIVLRDYYPPEMSNTRARAYAEEALHRPMENLVKAQRETAEAMKNAANGEAVAHWFKSDLRCADNTSLALAAQKAKEMSVPLLCFYLLSPQDLEAHLRAPVRVDFILRTLQVLKDDLAKLDIPLYIETVEERAKIPARVLELLDSWGCNHLCTNLEYEVDELRRETKLLHLFAEKNKSFEAIHDTCVVPPGQLRSGSGNQYAVYTPWYRSWMAHIHSNLELLELHDAPPNNPASARNRFQKLFDSKIPAAPKGKELSAEEKTRFNSLWPCGEHEAKARLDKFCEERIGEYSDQRNLPSQDGTSSLSVHLASGTISARTCVRTARDRNKSKKLDGGLEGIKVWISEVAWRDFYRHVLVRWPHVCMNKPYKPDYADIEWSYDQDHFKAWCEGKTGFPIIDAAMRQLSHTGYMHNRPRMIVASFLAKDLLIDWRMGEKHFMEHLVDGDFASNNGGWGFSASVGVDPQPYFRIFNPLRQSERFDPDGEYIRRWVPELKELDNKQIHDPYNRGAGDKAKKAGYPKPIVEHSECRARALAAYKAAVA
ncbi:DNA photolyase, FAD-binding/Cryptochrome [Cordyceps fumosorosea ARSEF 2679]|uniref:DNA photolyase, FAD-binding/Cryptochrome n=1 Tax=Cordyceps fumosorosea (strain ARSEF 2679) TaxID=1081104 RepID=A0A167V2L5_CORFA|nr:DNA photolyase, FAD-binding/Cryptochrome [Cordyceps fumosorosea ARSEF 2679]OAA62163.1 DNA photolyase, FAD-binding/Cryptochrome [Cordyceps fumosorosea ARSEF 2679]